MGTLTLILAILIPAALSLMLSLGLKSFAIKRKVAMQEPRDRDLHKSAKPRLGGLAIVSVFIVVMLSSAFLLPSEYTNFGFPFAVFGLSIDKRLLGILLATIFLSSVMLLDDFRGVKPSLKLTAQIVSALILIISGIGIAYLNNPFGLAIRLDNAQLPILLSGITYKFVFWADLLIIIWVIILTNATNFIDGLDGLASSLSAIAALVMIFLSLKMGQYAQAFLAAVFLGSVLGFLPLNLPKSKMFLGDTGSMFLGLMLAVLTVISGGKFATLLLVFGLVIIDAFYVILKRLIRGKNPFTTADQSHLHHRFLKAGFSPTSALITISAISLTFGLSALLTDGKTKIIILISLFIFSVMLFAYLDLKNKRPAKAGL